MLLIQKVITEHPARCRLGFVVLVMGRFGHSLFCRFCRGPSTEFLSPLPVSDKLKRTLPGAGSPAEHNEEFLEAITEEFNIGVGVFFCHQCWWRVLLVSVVFESFKCEKPCQ